MFEFRKMFGVDINIESEIPHGEGLGSSAAASVAVSTAIYSLFESPDKLKICKKATSVERIIHKNSSGADCYISTFGGLMYYQQERGFKNIQIRNKFLLVIGNTGIKHSTALLVSKVKDFKENYASLFEQIKSKAYSICMEAREAILVGDYVKLGVLMTENQKLLSDIGVSHSTLEKIIDNCIDNGALGAKLTGAGGGGTIIALFSKDNQEIISRLDRSIDWMFVDIDYIGINSNIAKI